LRHTSGKNTLCRLTNGNLLQTFNNGVYPKEASAATFCQVLPPSTARFVHNSIISKGVCRVFVLRCQSASHHTCFVSFFTCHNPVYTLIHSFIQSYIHTLILSHIHTSIHTQHIHNNIHAWLCLSSRTLFCPFSPVLTYHCAKWQVL